MAPFPGEQPTTFSRGRGKDEPVKICVFTDGQDAVTQISGLILVQRTDNGEITTFSFKTIVASETTATRLAGIGPKHLLGPKGTLTSFSPDLTKSAIFPDEGTYQALLCIQYTAGDSQKTLIVAPTEVVAK